MWEEGVPLAVESSDDLPEKTKSAALRLLSAVLPKMVVHLILGLLVTIALGLLYPAFACVQALA